MPRSAAAVVALLALAAGCAGRQKAVDPGPRWVVVYGKPECLRFAIELSPAAGTGGAPLRAESGPDGSSQKARLPLDNAVNEWALRVIVPGHDPLERRFARHAWGETFEVLALASGELFLDTFPAARRGRDLADLCRAEREASEAASQAAGAARIRRAEEELRGMTGRYRFRASCSKGSLREFVAQVKLAPRRPHSGLTIEGMGKKELPLNMVKSGEEWKISPDGFCEELFGDAKGYCLSFWRFSAAGPASRIEFRISHDSTSTTLGSTTYSSLLCTVSGMRID